MAKIKELGLAISSKKIDAEAIRHRAALALSRTKAKLQGIFKSKNKRNKMPDIPNFRFLDLPAELRDNVYRQVLDSETDVYLSQRFRGNLVTKSSLARVSRTIRQEFLSTMYIQAPKITAHVKDFDFRHIVTFLNRLSVQEMKTLVEGPSSRQMNIELSVTNDLGGYFHQVELPLLRRWINRLVHPAKKGTKIVASYKLVRYGYKYTERNLLRSMDNECGSINVRKMEEKAKIGRAILDGPPGRRM